MASLTPSDVKHWDADAIHQVFQTASNRAQTLQRLGDNLQQVRDGLSDWRGEAGAAFHADLGQTRRDIEADGQESRQVATAVSAAEADVRACKAELDGIEHAAHGVGWTITPDWRIDVGNTLSGPEGVLLAAQEDLLQGQLNTCKVHAHNADHELAMAVRAAVGQAPAAVSPAPAPPGAPKPQAGEPPKSWQDMLLPAGPAKPGAPGGAPAPQLKPADVESFKAMARQTMIDDGVPPDQIEARLNDIVGRTQQWMNNGMPNYVPPEPPKPPRPGFGDGFADHWFGFEDAVQRLTGQEGLGAMGDEWGGMAKGLAGKAEESLLLGPVAPINDLTHEFKSFLDNPAYYAGGKTADGAIALPGMMFGGEGAGLGKLAEIDPYAGLTHPPNLPAGFDNPTTYHPWSESAAQDLFSAFGHGEPAASLNQHLSDMVTHYVGDNPDRVVLGRWDGQDGGYIGEARGNGGIYFDTGDPTWKMLAQGLDTPQEQALVWPVNEQFLRTQMENHVGRIDYMLDTEKYASLEDMVIGRAGTYSALEVNYLSSNAAAFGYERVGNSWVYVGRG